MSPFILQTMKIRVFICLAIVMGFIACSGPKSLISLKESAANFSTQGNYTQAVEVWKQYFNQQTVEETDGASFASAAQAAYLAGDINLALKWYDEARYKNYSNEEMYLTLAKIYSAQDNLSKELSALEFYLKNFSQVSDEVYNRLFNIYFEIENYDEALVAWDKLGSGLKNELSNQLKYFQINLEKENSEVNDSLAQIILEKDPQNVAALEWIAKKYYWQAENRYQEQMEKYNSNKTTRQYRILLEELEKVTADFKKALPYFEKLWELNPGEKYASYMANIYARFGDQNKSDSYKKYIN